MAKRVVTVAASALLLGGCTVGPNFHAPRWASPASWFAGEPRKAQGERSEPVSAPLDPEWWSMFRDPRLTRLERQVAASNLNVQAAAFRVLESRAQLGITRAGLVPNINANGSYERSKPSNRGVFSLLTGGADAGTQGTEANGAFGNAASGIKNPPNLPAFDIFQYGLGASWEPDFFGRVRRSIESGEATLNAAEWAQRAALVAALAEVARDYITLRGTQEQLRIARDNVRTAQQGLNLTRQRAAAGVTTDLDVANASAQLETTAAQIPMLEAQERQLVNALSLLVALPPNALLAELSDPRPVPPVPRRVPVGFPSELARRRPDIREAEAQLHAATANVGVAVANFYPSITLNASFGFQAISQPFKVLTGDARQYSFGPGISVPIFQGGQLRQTLVLRKAEAREAAITYQRTVLAAWHDVANALIAFRDEQRRRDQLMRAVAQNRRALSLAQSRYSVGVAGFLEVLDAERNLLATEQQLATSTANVSSDLVSLYLALGGGWQLFEPQAGG
jgi:NodT family efflux transporter outer membrane factor (OMF) lipoprotein